MNACPDVTAGNICMHSVALGYWSFYKPPCCRPKGGAVLLPLMLLR
jgi:hypothetical protein